jgi:hypothetical protein
VPFIAFTGPSRAREVLAAGFVEQLLKPTENEVLVQAIQNAVATGPTVRRIA